MLLIKLPKHLFFAKTYLINWSSFPLLIEREGPMCYSTVFSWTTAVLSSTNASDLLITSSIQFTSLSKLASTFPSTSKSSWLTVCCFTHFFQDSDLLLLQPSFRSHLFSSLTLPLFKLGCSICGDFVESLDYSWDHWQV